MTKSLKQEAELLLEASSRLIGLAAKNDDADKVDLAIAMNNVAKDYLRLLDPEAKQQSKKKAKPCKVIYLRVDEEKHSSFQLRARSLGMSVTQWCLAILSMELESNGKDQKDQTV